MYSVYSSFVFLILTTVFVLGHCDGNYTEFEEIECTKENDSVIRAEQKNIICKPRHTIIALNPKPRQTFSPSSVSVSKCSGTTPEGYICAPKADGTRITKVPIVVHTCNDDLSPKKQCAVVNVEEHISCEQACIIKKSDCNGEQDYIKSRCKCMCKDEVNKRKECGIMGKKRWNEENCRCECKTKEKECTTGLIWKEDFCECMYK